jgi:hypothetical protein
VTVDGFVVAVELKPSVGSAIAVPADGGRIVPNSDMVAGTVSIALLDIPGLSPEQSYAASRRIIADARMEACTG